LFGPTTQSGIFNPGTRASEGFPSAHSSSVEVVMTEENLNQFELLDEFSITELEQQLEFEAWCDVICIFND